MAALPHGSIHVLLLVTTGILTTFRHVVENIDAYWAKIVYAVGAKDGALAKHSSCNTAKVAASPDDGGGQTYVICIYCDDSWDKKAVGEVLEILVKELKLVPSAYKVRRPLFFRLVISKFPGS